jgi:hypothetical protein
MCVAGLMSLIPNIVVGQLYNYVAHYMYVSQNAYDMIQCGALAVGPLLGIAFIKRRHWRSPTSLSRGARWCVLFVGLHVAASMVVIYGRRVLYYNGTVGIWQFGSSSPLHWFYPATIIMYFLEGLLTVAAVRFFVGVEQHESKKQIVRRVEIYAVLSIVMLFCLGGEVMLVWLRVEGMPHLLAAQECLDRIAWVLGGFMPVGDRYGNVELGYHILVALFWLIAASYAAKLARKRFRIAN